MGEKLPKEKQPVRYEGAKTIVKEMQRRRWLQQHPDFNSREFLPPLQRGSNNYSASWNFTLKT